MPERESAPPPTPLSAPPPAPGMPPFGELLASCAAARAVSRPPDDAPRPLGTGEDDSSRG